MSAAASSSGIQGANRAELASQERSASVKSDVSDAVVGRCWGCRSRADKDGDGSNEDGGELHDELIGMCLDRREALVCSG
jgi:hypothetical protein